MYVHFVVRDNLSGATNKSFLSKSPVKDEKPQLLIENFFATASDVAFTLGTSWDLKINFLCGKTCNYGS